MNTKDVLQKLSDVFSPKVVETELSEVKEEKEEVAEEVVEVELAEEDKEEAVVESAPTIEYATKLELEEMKRTFMQLFEALQKETKEKAEVPQELSKDEVELSSDVEEISHSPELDVEKRFELHKPKINNESLQSRIYSKLFN